MSRSVSVFFILGLLLGLGAPIGVQLLSPVQTISPWAPFVVGGLILVGGWGFAFEHPIWWLVLSLSALAWTEILVIFPLFLLVEFPNDHKIPVMIFMTFCALVSILGGGFAVGEALSRIFPRKRN